MTASEKKTMQNYNEKQNLDGFNTNKNLQNYATPYSSFVGGWFIDESICDELVKFFDLNTKLAEPGTTFSEDRSIINSEVKDSL